ncbi:hypothetical protein ACFWNK_30845 [Streptomyces sp. NPDC058417]|uniref:hypothetical protein n=1 Tax=unclassified Streptomyces TaxID=2593676 RepID=UPI00364B192E
MTPQQPAPSGRSAALPPARPAVLFSDEASAVDRAHRTRERVGAARSPLEHLTWRQPPATDIDHGGTA